MASSHLGKDAVKDVNPVTATKDQEEISWTDIKINTKTDVHEFMREIQIDFIRLFDIIHLEELTDVLSQYDQVTDTDIESLSGKDVNCRKDRARKLWFLLGNLPPEQFKAAALPYFMKWYPHILPRRWRQQTELKGSEPIFCLRHRLISRVRAASMADVVYNCGCIDYEQYRKFAQHAKEDIWPSLLEALCSRHSADVRSRVLQGLRDLLIHYKLHVPEDLPDLLSRGLPCTCRDLSDVPHPAVPDLLAQVKVGEWLARRKQETSLSEAESSCGYPDDDASSVSTDSTLTEASVQRKRGHCQQKLTDMKLRVWAKRRNVDKDILEALLQQEFMTLDDVKMISEQDVTDLFLKTNLLSGKKCLILKEALRQGFMLFDPLTVTPVPPHGTVVDTRLLTENSQPWVKCLIVSPSSKELFLLDNNARIKVFSLVTDEMLSVISLDVTPSSMTFIPEDLLVLTSSKEKLLVFVDVTNRSKPCLRSKVPTKRPYRGIAARLMLASSVTFFVSCMATETNPASVDMLSVTGELLETVTTSLALPELVSPRHLHFDSQWGLLYVSDWKSNCIFRVDVNQGMVIDKLVHPKFRCLQQVSTDSGGNLYVASDGAGCVLLMTAGEAWRKLLSGKKHGEQAGEYDMPTGVGVTETGLVVSWCGRQDDCLVKKYDFY